MWRWLLMMCDVNNYNGMYCKPKGAWNHYEILKTTNKLYICEQIMLQTIEKRFSPKITGNFIKTVAFVLSKMI